MKKVKRRLLILFEHQIRVVAEHTGFGQACHQPCSPPPTGGPWRRAFEGACLPTDFGFAILQTGYPRPS
jgi:hypothetical protein